MLGLLVLLGLPGSELVLLGLPDSDLGSSLYSFEKLSVIILLEFSALLLVILIRLELRSLLGYLGLSTRFLLVDPRLSAGLFHVHLR